MAAQIRRLAGLAGFCLVVSACVAVPVNADRMAFADAPSRNAVPRSVVQLVPEQTLLLDVRLDRQVAYNGCGAHAVAAVIDYWTRATPNAESGPGRSGVEIQAATPPSTAAGYSLAEVVALLRESGMTAVAIDSTVEGVKRELAAGRPVIARVSLSPGYLTTTRLFAADFPVLGAIEGRAADITARLLDPIGSTRIDHYWIVIGHDETHMIVLDPALGVRAVRNTAFSVAFERGGRLAVVSGGWRS